MGSFCHTEMQSGPALDQGRHYGDGRVVTSGGVNEHGPWQQVWALQCMWPHPEQLWQQPQVQQLLRLSPEKRLQMQCIGVYGKAGITLRPHTEEMPQFQPKSYYLQQQVQKEVQSHQCGTAGQRNGNSSTSYHDRSNAHGHGDEHSGAWLYTHGSSSGR